jgi:hypothetical protein
MSHSRATEAEAVVTAAVATNNAARGGRLRRFFAGLGPGDGHGRGAHVSVNQKHLLLSAYPPHAALDLSRFEHPFQSAQVGQQCLHEDDAAAVVRLSLDCVFAHKLKGWLASKRFRAHGELFVVGGTKKA